MREMMNAVTARKMTEVRIDEEIKAIEEEIKKQASKGSYEITHRLPWGMSGTEREVLVRFLEFRFYKVSSIRIYDNQSGFDTEDLKISWEQEEDDDRKNHT